MNTGWTQSTGCLTVVMTVGDLHTTDNPQQKAHNMNDQEMIHREVVQPGNRIYMEVVQPHEDAAIPGYPLSFDWQPNIGFCVWYVANKQKWTVTTVTTGTQAPLDRNGQFLGTGIELLGYGTEGIANALSAFFDTPITFVLHAFRIPA